MLCRDRCGYCTFAKAPARVTAPYLLPEEVLAIAEAGKAAGCHEALFTLGERPELRYPVAAEWLAAHGYASTVDYLAAMCRLVLEETGLLPHANAGALDADRAGHAAARLGQPGHDARVAGRGPGRRTGGRPTRCRPGAWPPWSSPASWPSPSPPGSWSASATRGPTSWPPCTPSPPRTPATGTCRRSSSRTSCPSRARPCSGPRPARPRTCSGPLRRPAWCCRPRSTCRRRRTSPTIWPRCSTAGIDDWGGVSPVTADHVNPERAWPALDVLRAATEAAGHTLAPRLTVYPTFALDPARWLDPALRFPVLDASDAEGLARDSSWCSGGEEPPPPLLDGPRRAAAPSEAVPRRPAVPWPRCWRAWRSATRWARRRS